MRRSSLLDLHIPWVALTACFALTAGCDTGDAQRIGANVLVGGGSTFGCCFDGGIPDGAFGDVPVWEGGNFVNFDPYPTGSDASAQPDPDAAGELSLVERAPAIDATDVATDASIELTFSQALNPLLTPSVRLTVARSDLVVQTRVQVDGARLTARPLDPLLPGERYRVSVGTVMNEGFDSLGPRDWDSEWTFSVAHAPETVPLSGPLDEIAYDPERDRLWGVAREARQLVLVDLEAGEEVAREPLLYVPSDLCVAPDGASVFIANRRTSLIVEVDANSREVLREIPWPGGDDGAADAHLHVRCGEDVLWLADAADAPGLWSVDLSADTPVATDHGSLVTGVGDLAVAADGASLVYWSQQGWGEQEHIEVRAVDTVGFDVLDAVDIGPSTPTELPLDVPLFVDPSGTRVITRNRVLAGDDLSIVLFTFGAGEVLRAVDFARDRAASLTDVYSLSSFVSEAPVARPGASHVFFERDGALRLVMHEPPRIERQAFEPDAEAQNVQ